VWRRKKLDAEAAKAIGFSIAERIDAGKYQTVQGAFSPALSRLVAPTPQSAGIFISYRREDQPSFAGRLYDRLVTQFGRDRIFIDIDTIDLGLDFEEVINTYLSNSKALLVVIGKDWATIKDSLGHPRLRNPDDFVRLEIETGLRRGIRVIPVLVEDAKMPKSTELPQQISSLARRNSIAITHANFSADVNRLISTLDRVLSSGQP
jgi:hypothetical protein